MITAWGAAVLGSVVAIFNAVLAANRGCKWWYSSSLSIVAAAAAVVGLTYLITKDKHVTLMLLGGLALAHVSSGVASSLLEDPWTP